MNGKIVWRRELIVNFEKFGNSELFVLYFITSHVEYNNIYIYVYKFL